MLEMIGKMKNSRRHLRFVLILGLVMTAFFVTDIRQAVSSVLSPNNPHNLSAGSYGSSFATLQVCVFCHTPHGANIDQSYETNPALGASNGTFNQGNMDGMYLWNRRTPDLEFDTYTSGTLTNTTSNASPGLLSIMCLSCHDGVGALNVLLNYPGQAGFDITYGGLADAGGGGINQFGDIANSRHNIGDAICGGDMDTVCTTPGLNLMNDHPIGMIYNTVQADPSENGLRTMAEIALEPGGPNLIKRFEVTDGLVECSTCHDPHLDNDAASGGNNFLIMDNTDSKLCTACHKK